MARKRVYPQEPGSNKKDIPFAKEVFKKWCVNRQGLSEGTADVYISNIRTVFTTLFDDEDPLFSNVRLAFLSPKDDPELRISKLENAYETLVTYAETVDECADIELDELNLINPGEQSKTSPKGQWVRSFQCYCRFIRWVIDTERHNYKMKIEVKDDPATFLEIPMKKQFRRYMETKGSGYTKTTIDTYCSKLSRLYNLLIRRVQKHHYFESLGARILKGGDVGKILDVFKKRIDFEMEYETFSDLSDDDVERGRNAFMVYREFLEDFACDPQKYSVDEYEIPQKERERWKENVRISQYRVVGDIAEFQKAIHTANYRIKCCLPDFKKFLKRHIPYYVATATAAGEDCIYTAMKSALTTLPADMENISRMLFCITGSGVSAEDLGTIMSFWRELPDDMDVSWGTALDETLLSDHIKVTLVAAGKD